MFKYGPQIPDLSKTFIMNECLILPNAFHTSNEIIMCFFVFDFVYIVDYIVGFLYIKPSLHHWNETYLVKMDNCFVVFLDSVSKNFIEYFCIDIHMGN